MWIKQIRVRGYKSLADVTLSELGAINVFHGQNDTGKSNLLEALDLLAQLFPLCLTKGGGRTYLDDADLFPYTRNVFRFQNSSPRNITWDVQLYLEDPDKVVEFQLRLSEIGPREIEELGKALALELTWVSDVPDEKILDQLAKAEAGFHLINARRYFQQEITGPLNSPFTLGRHSLVTSANLKRTLVGAFNSLDQEERDRFERLTQLLENHFGLSGFTAGQSKPNQRGEVEYVLGFRVFNVREVVPIEQRGSGVQQIVLMLAQILFNPARIVGIEEPEMNLSPEWQVRLMDVFRDLVQPGPGGLDQIFITSHSLVFKPDSAHYFDVDYQNQATVVMPRPLDERQKYFKLLGLTQEVGEDLGPYLNAQGQITLPQRVIEDLGLHPYEPVFFVREGEYWRLRTKEEILQLMEAEEQAYADTDQDCA